MHLEQPFRQHFFVLFKTLREVLGREKKMIPTGISKSLCNAERKIPQAHIGMML